MKIYHKDDAIRVSKPEGIDVTYYLFDEYEVHYNEQAPNTTQTWHHHEKIWETLYIIEGELTARWREKGIEKSVLVKAGDVLETDNTSHTFSNENGKTARFLVIKQVVQGVSHKEILKTDKIIDE